MSFLLDRCKKLSDQLEEYTEFWKIDHERAMRARDLEELVILCAEGVPLMRRAWDGIVEGMFSDAKCETIFQAEEMVKQVIRRVVRSFRRADKLVAAMEQAGYPIDGSTELKDYLQELVKLEKEAHDYWPGDSPRIRASMEACNRGEYRSAEDMLRELQGGGSSTN